MNFAMIGAPCEAAGHPSDCQEPAVGEVKQTSSHNITFTDASGDTKEVATEATADIHFDSHAHDYSELEGCHDNQSHDIDPDTDKMSPITINGSQIYLVDTAVTSDPGSGGDVEIVSER